MGSKLTFKADITRKFMFFSLVPSFILALSLIFIIINLKENSLKEPHIGLPKSTDYKLHSFYTELEMIERIVRESSSSHPLVFNDILRFKTYVSSIVVLDMQGEIQKIHSKQEIKSHTRANYIKNINIKDFLATKKSFLGDVYFFEATNESYMPYIFEHKGSVYILNINLEYFNNYIKSLVGDDRSIRLCIVDKNGLCLVNSLDLNTVKNRASFYDTAASKAIPLGKEYELIEFKQLKDNEISRLTYSNQKETGWMLVVKDEGDKVYPLVRNIIVITGIFLLLISLLVVIISKKVAQSIVQPLENLIFGIQDFANDTNSDETKNSITSKYYIFSVLVDSFEKMKNQIIDREMELKNLNEHLEEKIEEKTALLEDANYHLKIKIDEEMEQNKIKEKLLFEQSKMAVMGEMIGNIAHQWRQPLSMISSLASGIVFQKEMGVFDDKSLEPSMNKITNATLFLSQTIDDFRNFLRDDKEKTVFLLDEAFDKTMLLVEHGFKQNNIEIESSVASVKVYGFKNELIQGLLNILNNAKDALVDTQSTIRTIFIQTIPTEKHISLLIKDTAGGIPNGVIERIFDPYFTTKGEVHGTGIGLYMTKEIIEKHLGGKITVENKETIIDGVAIIGAEFVITLPCVIENEHTNPQKIS